MAEPTGEHKTGANRAEFQSDHSLIQYPFLDVANIPEDSPERKIAEFVNIMVFNHVEPISVAMGVRKKEIDSTSPNGWSYNARSVDGASDGKGWIVKPFLEFETSPDIDFEDGIVVMANGQVLYTITNPPPDNKPYRVIALKEDAGKSSMKDFIAEGSLTEYLDKAIDDIQTQTESKSGSAMSTEIALALARSIPIDESMDPTAKLLAAAENLVSLQAAEAKDNAKVASQIKAENKLAEDFAAKEKARIKKESDDNAEAFIAIMKENHIPATKLLSQTFHATQGADGTKYHAQGWIVKNLESHGSNFPVSGIILLENGETYTFTGKQGESANSVVLVNTTGNTFKLLESPYPADGEMLVARLGELVTSKKIKNR